MHNTKENGANIKSAPKMALRARKAMNQEGNNTLSTSNLQENNEKSFVDTIRKIAKEEFKEHKTNEWNDL